MNLMDDQQAPQSAEGAAKVITLCGCAVGVSATHSPNVISPMTRGWRWARAR
jgi:hypothetical protein